MTAEDKARELGIKYQTPCHGIGDCEFEAYQSAKEMSDWKDEGFLEWLKTIDTYSLKEKSRYIKLAIKKLENTMANQQKYRIVADMDSLFSVEEKLSGIWCKRFIAGKGKAGLELAEEWLANRKEN